MNNKKFWEVIKKYNSLMISAIEGPSCLEVCNGDCCSIKIDIPKVLAVEYINQSYADKKDFIRSDIFTFHLRFDEEKAKCFLFDKTIKGCKVHYSGIKPPQCWIYPTNFTNPEHKDISCKRINGWKIVEPEKAIEAEKLLKYYIFLCELEAKKELKEMKIRLNNNSSKNNLRNLLKFTPPSQLAGFKDTWDCFTILHAQGVSLQMKKFCKRFNDKCEMDYLRCSNICGKVIEGLLKFLQQNLFKYVQKNGLDSEGEYSFLKLTEFSKN